MAEYALLDAANAILEYRQFDSVPNDPIGKNWRWLPVIVTDPAFNSETEVKEGPVVTIEPMRVTRIWTVRAKTTAELDAGRTAKIDDVAEAILRAICNHENRIRALQTPPDPAVTLAQCRAALKALLP